MGERNRKIVRIVILIVAVLGICLGGIVAVDLLMPKEKVEDTPIPSSNPSPTISPLPSEEPVEEKEVSMELAEEIYSNLYDSFNHGEILYSHYASNLITPDDFSNEEKNSLIIRELINGNLSIGENRLGNPKYSKEQIIETKNQIFGINARFEIINAPTGECLQFYLEENVLFQECKSKTDGWITYYYHDANKIALIEQKEFLHDEDCLGDYKNIDWNYYAPKSSLYQHRYRKNEDGTYTFIQIEKIK